MKPSHSTGRNVIAILAIPIVMLFLIVITPFSFGIASPFDLCGMIDAGSRATSLSFVCRGVFYEYAIPTGSWQSKLPLLGKVDGCSPYFCLEPQALNYLIDDQPLDSITLAYDYAPNTDERHMNQVLDKLLGQCGLTAEAGRTIYSNRKLKRTELRLSEKSKGETGPPTGMPGQHATRANSDTAPIWSLSTPKTELRTMLTISRHPNSASPKQPNPPARMKSCRDAH